MMYPERKKEVYKFAICKCGHYRHIHEYKGMIEYIKEYLHLFLPYAKCGGHCSICMCPSYKFDKFDTYKEEYGSYVINNNDKPLSNEDGIV